MEYKNTKTGVTFSSPCVISGGDWVLVEDNKKTEQSKREMEKQEKQDQPEDKAGEVAEKQVEEDKTGDPAFDSITVPQIKQELDAFGIKYSATAKKQELYDLMMSQGK
ncbi:hypothetical protein FUT28_13360 [Enterococcus durans]|uniref:hypothetical protein n=1 Tax=Enterococcus TaxID=1350 RepID=UPI0010C23F3D|nr:MULTISPECIES: hypothetical protein [Enterococcus]QED60694.1 hypothetical protein FS851_13320 [Enterococcus durans]QED63297.1 hypothetical protein FUT28_13360 [Enterococcus durans]TKN14697.1 hypothetical protein DVW83_13555 [Enterococcus sp. VV15]